MLKFLNPWVLLGALVAAAGAGAFGFKLGKDFEVAQQARLEKRIQEVEDAAARGAAKEIGKIRIEHKTINRDAETVLREVPVYRDCSNDDRIARLLDAARTGKAPPESGGGSGVPAVGTGEP